MIFNQTMILYMWFNSMLYAKSKVLTVKLTQIGSCKSPSMFFFFFFFFKFLLELAGFM